MTIRPVLFSLLALGATLFVQFACDSIENVELGTPMGNPDDSTPSVDGDSTTDDDDDDTTATDNLVQTGPAGSITGRAIFNNSVLGQSPKLVLFKVGDRFDATPVDEDTIPNTPDAEASTTSFDFTFENIAAGTYRLAVYLDSNDTTDEKFSYEFRYFPALIPTTSTEGAEIRAFYVSLQNPAYGRITGSVYVPEENNDLIVEVQLFGSTDNNNPVSLYYSTRGSVEGTVRKLDYDFLNLPSDTYRVVALAYICGLDHADETAITMLNEQILVNRELSVTLENTDKNMEFLAAELVCPLADDDDDDLDGDATDGDE